MEVTNKIIILFKNNYFNYFEYLKIIILIIYVLGRENKV